MKVALITDTHWGVRNDHQAFLDNNKVFLDTVFFPTIDKLGIKKIVHLGDLTDRRKYVNFVTARRLRRDFIDKIVEREIELDVILGNHDTVFKNTNEVNSVQELYHSADATFFKWYDRATEVMLGDELVMYIPWICDENAEDTVEKIAKTRAQVAMGHLEVEGFEMYRGVPSHGGINPEFFSKFDWVGSGHYHHKSSKGNIHYLGAHGEFTWSDYDDPRGFHIFDTTTREAEFIVNPHRMFEKVHYRDGKKTVEEVLAEDFSRLKGKFVKVIVGNKSDTTCFDMFIDQVEKAGPLAVQVVDDHRNLDLEEDEHIIDEAEDTLTIFRKTIASSNTTGIDPARLEGFVTELFNEALSVE